MKRLQRRICGRKCVPFKVLACFNCSMRTNKAALLRHRDTGGRGKAGNREREMNEMIRKLGPEEVLFRK